MTVAVASMAAFSTWAGAADGDWDNTANWVGGTLSATNVRGVSGFGTILKNSRKY